MANILTTTNTEIYQDTVVEGFRSTIAPMKDIFVMDASPAPAERGALVKVLTIPSGSTPTAFVAGTGFTIQDATRVGVDVTLGNYYYNSTGLNGKELNDSSIINIKQLGNIQATELANTVFYDNLNYLSSSNVFPVYTTFASASSVDPDTLVDLRTYCVENMRWTGPAYLVVNSKVFGALLKHDDLKFIYRGQADVVTGANLFRSVRNVFGWNAIFEAPALPFTNNVVGYCVTPRALAVAMRYWAPQEGGTLKSATPIQDPEGSGITLGYRELVNQTYDRVEGIWTALWGKAVTNNSGSLVLKATSNS